MKTTVKHLATLTLIALSFIVLNARAEGTETKDSTRDNNEIAFLYENLTKSETELSSAIISFSEMVLEAEPVMELENWMTKSETWNNNISCIDETEATLELEGWMFAREVMNEATEDKDEVLTIESWMTDSNLWK